MLNVDRIKDLRERKGITQTELAKILKIDRSHYCHYENGDETIRLIHLNAISNYYKVSIDYLFHFTDEPKYNSIREEIDIKLFAKRLLELREKFKLKQIDLARVINASNSAICNYEKGRQIISTSFLFNICQKYKISADYLLGKTDSPRYFE